MHSPWNYGGLIQQQIPQLASPPLFLQDGLIDTVQVWGNDLELASPGGFDSCIMDSSWTSSKELCTASSGPHGPASPSSSAVSTRNLSHSSLAALAARLQQQHQQEQGQHPQDQQNQHQNQQQQQQQQQQIVIADHHVDVSSSTSSASLFISQGDSAGNKNASSNKLLTSSSSSEMSASKGGRDDHAISNVKLPKGNQRGPTERMMDISLEDLTPYFTMPITQASKELNVGLTVLKKRCREFNIPRWPHRKLKSLESLIHKSQELAKDSDGNAPNPVIYAVQELEKQKKRMEESPGLELDDRTKRFRQAVFKASYKQRRRANCKESDDGLKNNNVDEDEQEDQADQEILLT